MRLDDYNNADGKRVWLSQDEYQRVLDTTDDTTRTLAFQLGGRSGLRVSEVTQVTYRDLLDADDGFLRVWGDYAKRDKYREVPVPDRVRYSVEALADSHNPDDEIIPASRRTVRRWVSRAGAELEEETGNVGWSYLGTHDLRRTWAAWCLYERGVVPAVVFAWGGWSDWQTFRDSYLGTLSPEAARRERDRAYGSVEPNSEVQELYQHAGTATASE